MGFMTLNNRKGPELVVDKYNKSLTSRRRRFYCVDFFKHLFDTDAVISVTM